MGNDLVKRLKACANGAYREPETLQKYCGEAAARIEALEGALKEAREALKPFAEEAKDWSSGTDETYRPDFYNEAFSVGDFRRAARVYSNEKPRD